MDPDGESWRSRIEEYLCTKLPEDAVPNKIKKVCRRLPRNSYDPSLFVVACGIGHLGFAKFLSSHPKTNLKDDLGFAIWYACSCGRFEIVRFLSSICSLGDYNYQVIRAGHSGNVELIRFLSELPGVDFSEEYNEPILWACRNGNLDAVKLLLTLPGVSATENDGECIIEAASKGHLELVKFLCTLPGTDPHALNSLALSSAVMGGFLDVVKFLCSIPGVDTNTLWCSAMDAESKGYHEIAQYLRALEVTLEGSY